MSTKGIVLLIFLCFPCVGSVADVIGEKWGEPVHGVKMAVKTGTVYAGGTSVELTILVTNTSGAVAEVGQSDTYKMFGIVVECDGKAVPLTSWGRRQLSSAGESSFYGMKLGDGEVRPYKIPLSRLFDLSEEGKYSVAVQWRTGVGVVKAQLVSFEITEDVPTTKPATVPLR